MIKRNVLKAVGVLVIITAIFKEQIIHVITRCSSAVNPETETPFRVNYVFSKIPRSNNLIC